MADDSPPITSFEHYAPFLKARFRHLKSKRSSFSHGYCARKIGSTDSYLKNVLEGRRRVGLTRVSKIARVFDLGKFETQYFTIQVIRELTKDPETKTYLSFILGRLRFEEENLGGFKDERGLSHDLFPVSHWLYAALLELMTFPDFVDDGKWIRSRLIDGDRIDEAEIGRRIQDLIDRGIVRKDGKRYVREELILSSPNPYDKTSFRAYRGIVDKVWEVLGDPGRYGKNHFLEVVVAVGAEDEARLFAAAERYRDEVVKIMRETSGTERMIVLSNNVFNLLRRSD